MSDRSVRNLAHLQDSASTARVLNLLRTGHRNRTDPDWAAKPFFQSALLNRSLIIKHRLRPNEVGEFSRMRTTATKVVIPIDGDDLRVGGRAIFVGQNNYDLQMTGLLGDVWQRDPRDKEMLRLLDEVPSLDPFLLREHLRRHEREPARCYFEISDADMKRMLGFVEREIQKLVDLCFAGSSVDSGADGRGSRLVQKILSNAVDAETEPLRLTLKLEKREYQEGVFCWRGFLYYKWSLAEASQHIARVLEDIGDIRPRGSMTTEMKVDLQRTRENVKNSILEIRAGCRGTLKIYDDAFASLTGGKPTAFRDFLLGAPALFTDLGERLGAINHIVSFWIFRFPKGGVQEIGPEDLLDILKDFEGSLSFHKPQSEAPTLSQRQGLEVMDFRKSANAAS